jgi:hypothetical protein
MHVPHILYSFLRVIHLQATAWFPVARVGNLTCPGFEPGISSRRETKHCGNATRKVNQAHSAKCSFIGKILNSWKFLIQYIYIKLQDVCAIYPIIADE